MKEAPPLKSWGIYHAEGRVLRFLGVISARDQAEAVRKARLLNPEIAPAEITARIWEGPRA